MKQKKRSSIAPLALAGVCLSGLAEPAVAAPKTSEWSCVASAKFRGHYVGTAWKTAQTRSEAAEQAKNACSSRAGSRTCTVRRCYQE